MPDVKGFWQRHLAPPAPLGIIVIGVLIAMITGLAGAAIWTGSETTGVRQGLSLPTPSVLPTAAPAPLQTTTTKPDLSVEALESKLAPEIWSLTTLDAAGQPSAASAFVVGSAGGQTFLITSLAAVEASTREPGPAIIASNGTENGPATLWSWEEERDIALVAIGRTQKDDLPWANGPVQPKAGDKIFAMAAVENKRVTPGIITSVAGGIIEHNVFIDDQRRGGPLVNVKGEVVGISSAAFTGGRNPTDAAFFSVPIHAICENTITCGGANAPRVETTPSSDPSGTTTSAAPPRRQPATTTGEPPVPSDTEPAPEE